MKGIGPETKLRLRREFEVIPLGEATVLVRSPAQGVRVAVEGLTAEALGELLRNLDGSRSLAALLDGRSSFDTIKPLVDGLLAREILEVRSGDDVLTGSAKFFSHTHDDPIACWRRLTTSRVAVVGTMLLVEAVADAVRIAGVHDIRTITAVDSKASEVRSVLAGRAGAVDLVIVCQNGTQPDLEATVNALALERGFVWLPIRLFGGEGFVGPLFVPGDGPCHSCVQAREEANWADPELTRKYLDQVARRPESVEAYGSLPAFAALVAHWAALEATKYLARFTVPTLIGNILRIEFAACRTQVHRIFRLPRCTSCSPMARRPGVNGLSYAEPS